MQINLAIQGVKDGYNFALFIRISGTCDRKFAHDIQIQILLLSAMC